MISQEIPYISEEFPFFTCCCWVMGSFSTHRQTNWIKHTAKLFHIQNRCAKSQGRTFEKKLSAENLKYRLLGSMTNQVLSVPGDWAPPSVSIFFSHPLLIGVVIWRTDKAARNSFTHMHSILITFQMLVHLLQIPLRVWHDESQPAGQRKQEKTKKTSYSVLYLKWNPLNERKSRMKRMKLG